MNLRPARRAVHATDDQIEIVGRSVAIGNVMGDGLPVESPEQVQPVDKDNGFE